MNMSSIEFRIVLSRFFILVSLLIFLSLILEGCGDKCDATSTYYYYEPVYTRMDELRAQVAVENPRDIHATGKIYVFGNMLYVNEPGEGIHVINNADPSNPQVVNFINIPGNVDLAAKGNFLYADSYVDILTFDLSDPNDIKLVDRIEDVYENISSFGFGPDLQLGVVTEWKETEEVVTGEINCETFTNSWVPWRGGVLMDSRFFLASGSSASAPESIAAPAGMGGSMARFAITGENLYAVDTWQMFVFDIADQDDPQLGNTVNLGWGIETIFPYKENLFIGANNGMHIYDNSNPSDPQYLSSFMHFTACDPVVVNDDYAFVTLRSGNACQGFINQLDVVDIKDLTQPELVKTYPMDNPHGLGIDGNQLFLCEGEFGLKVFDIEDVNAISDNLKQHIENLHAFDVIPFQNVLILIGEGGLYQYDYSNPEELSLLSQISITPVENQ